MKPLIRLFSGIVLLWACLGAAPARAEVRALLVGVSDYRHLDADLRGPANDVGLMAEALLARGADSVTVLAAPGARVPEGVAPPQEPTRAAILAGLRDLAERAGPGDTALFYFSGHGAQAPDTNGDEAGGYDEILLPADVTGWSGGTVGMVGNALVDDEFPPLFQAILDKGAALVAIVDACHSATGFRAVGAGQGVARYVSPSQLNLPDPETVAQAAAEAGHGMAQAVAPLTGDFVFLYSAQSDERAFEYPLGDRENPGNWYGDFTRALAGILRDTPDLTWAQALNGARDAMQAGLPTAVQTPDGEGSALESAVFGSGAPGTRRVAFANGTLSAGLLSGYSDGAVMELYRSATSSEPLGRATLREVSAHGATLVPGDGDLPDRGYAVQLRPGMPAPFRLSPPVVQDAGDYAPILDELAALAAGGLPEGVQWNAPVADATPILTGGQLALAGPDAVLDPLGPGSTPRLAGDPVTFFEGAARAHRLRRALVLAETVRPTGFALAETGLKIMSERAPGAPAAEGCGEPTAGLAAFDPGKPVGHCDRIWLLLTNNSATAQDVTVLYLDRDFNISVLWPEPGLSNRIAFGETREVGFEVRSPDGLPGQEEVIVLAVPAEPGSPRTVLAGLADPSVPRGGAGAPALQLYLEAASDPTVTTRNVGFTGAIAPIKITRMRLNLVPGAR